MAQGIITLNLLHIYHYGMEEALYNRMSFQKFLSFDCFGGVIPDKSSICHFRHLLKSHGLSQKILRTAKDHDINALDALLHGEERAVFGDSAYNKNDDKRPGTGG